MALTKFIQSKTNVHIPYIHFPEFEEKIPIKSQPKIIIIGGGFAGCSSAYTLKKYGVNNITLFEASYRLGGRVRSEGGIELGGEFIGLNHKWWLYFSKIFNLSLNLITPEKYYRANNCKMSILTKKGKIEDEDRLFQEVLYVREQLGIDARKIKNPFEPWNEPDSIREWDNVSLLKMLNRLQISNETRDVIKAQFKFDNLGDPSVLSYLGVLCQIQGGSPNKDGISFWNLEQVYRCSEGNETLAYKLTDGIEIKYGKVCNKISGDKVFFEDGTVEQFDYCIVAVPLKQYAKIEGISHLFNPSYGFATKLFTILPSRVWYGKNCSPNNLDTTLGETWESSENQVIDQVFFTLFTDQLKEENIIEKLFGDTNKYDKILIDWEKEKYIEMGYSYVGLGDTSLLKKYSSVGKVSFTGEHTDPVFYGYMEGALRSGVDVALKILKSLE